MADQEILLQIKGLKTYFFTRRGVVRAVDGVSLVVRRGEALGIVGESGCGKSVTCLSILRLVPEPAGRIVEGEILFDGYDLLKKDESAMRRFRGNRISLIPQDPMTSLNPVFTIGDQMAAPLKAHRKLPHGRALKRAEELLTMMHIPSPAQRLRQYPHQMSGGMRQRILGGISISCQPSLLIADEATTALDVISQDRFIHVLKEIQTRQRLSMLWITHDMSVVAKTCDRVAVMYAGKIIESASVEDVFFHPLHPYTKGLIKSIPKIQMDQQELFTIPGHPPDPINLPPGCHFSTRCKEAKEICLTEYPPATTTGGGHSVSCWLMVQNDG